MNRARVRYESGKLKHAVEVGRHRLASDVPVAEGGEDLAPSPHDLLAASLASCTSLTLRLYAQRKGWPLEDADTTVTLEHVGEASRFTVQVRLVGPLTEDQRARLEQIAERCPIHRALKGPIEILTELAPGAPGPAAAP